MRNLNVELAVLHPAQQQIIDGLRRFTVLACGRRFGKTELLSDIAVNDLLDGRRVAYFTPTYRMGAEVWRRVNSILGPVATYINHGERRMELLTGGIFEAWAMSGNVAQSVRGRKYHRALLDEAAFVRGGMEAWEEAIRPLLTDYRGSAVFASTPKGLNWFYDLYIMGLDPAYPQWASFQFPTVANPYISPDEVEESRRTMSDRAFRQEFLAEFNPDAGTVFRNIHQACKWDIGERRDGHEYVMGIDWGRDIDFTVASVIDVTYKRQVDLLRFNEVGWEIQRGRIVHLYQKWLPNGVVAEANAMGSPNIEALQKDGVPVESFLTTVRSKAPLIESLSLALERGELELLKDAVQKAEFQAYSYDRMPGGGLKYGAPEGKHDDCVIATALAWHASDTVGGLGIG